MNATVAAPDLRLLAPAFAGRFALIIAGLVALIARAFLHDPKLTPLIVPLYRCLNRTVRVIATLVARPGTSRIPHHRPGRSGSRTPKPRIPTTHAWLVVTLRHEAAGYASQLSHLLNEPGVPDLLAAAPTAGRLLRPLCRMLGVDPPLRGAASQGAEVSAFENPESPDTTSRAVASQATGALPRQRQQRSRVANAGRPESAAAPSRTGSAHPPPPTPPPGISEAAAAPPALPIRPPPPCPHVGWPWFPRPRTKPT